MSCWGANGSGQLGDGTATDRSIPVAVSGIGDATGVASGDGHTCAVLVGGAVKCWGYNGQGQVGDATTTSRLTPVAVSVVSDATAVAAGPSHTCALRTGGTVLCWGANGYGQVGDGTTTDRSTPVAVEQPHALDHVVQTAAGWAHTCTLRTGGTVSCWGFNGYGQLVTAPRPTV